MGLCGGGVGVCLFVLLLLLFSPTLHGNADSKLGCT